MADLLAHFGDGLQLESSTWCRFALLKSPQLKETTMPELLGLVRFYDFHNTNQKKPQQKCPGNAETKYLAWKGKRGKSEGESQIGKVSYFVKQKGWKWELRR